MKKKARRTKQSLKTALVDVDNKYYFILSDFLALVTFISVLAIVLETVPSLAQFSSVFLVLEWVTVIIFSVEYVWRLWLSKKKVSYICSWLGVVDLISILPTYLGLGNWTFLKSARMVRLIRLLRLLRVAKMRNLKGVDLDEKLSFYTINVLLFLMVIVSAALLSGILIYLVEGMRPEFHSIPHGMWWAFQIFVGDPNFAKVETDAGQSVFVFTRLVSLIVFGSLVGVIGNVIKDGLFGGKN